MAAMQHGLLPSVLPLSSPSKVDYRRAYGGQDHIGQATCVLLQMGTNRVSTVLTWPRSWLFPSPSY